MRPFHLSIIASLVLGFLISPALARGAENILVSVTLNKEKKGEIFVLRTETGDFLVRTVDLEAMGVKVAPAYVSEVEGERVVSLHSLPDVSFVFHEKTIALEIFVPPALLPTRMIDFSPPRKPKVYYPKDSGGFLNYSIQYTAGDSFDFQSLDIVNTLGVRAGDFLLLSDSSYGKTPDEETFVRLMSSLTYDRRHDLQRAVVGDFFASSGDLGSSVNLGGLGFSKVYSIDPYFLRNPLAGFTGLLPFPSEVEVYLDGSRIRSESLPPGVFELRNLPGYDGRGMVTVVVKDPFGGERRMIYPFYFTDVLLRKGLHEYSYNIGFLRRDFGSESNRYGGPAFSAFHRYGFTDSLTTGIHTEGSRGGANLGPYATYRIRNAGVVTISLAGSLREGGRAGGAGLIDYVYQDRRINTRLFFRGFSRDYVRAAEEEGADRIRFTAGGGAGYRTREFGSLSVDFSVTGKYRGQNRKTGSLSYSRDLWMSCRLFLSYRRVYEEKTSDQFFLGLTWYPGRDLTVSANYQREEGADTETLQIQKNPPIGEGYGFRGTVERKDLPQESATTIAPYFQYNGKYGIYTAEYLGRFRDGGKHEENYRISAAGGVTYAGGAFGASRPITDSFGIVTVDGLEGVRVYQNNQEIGRTDARGRVLLPGLTSYYENQVSINDRDIPIEYSLSEVVKYVSPPLRSGSLIHFEAKRIQAITGTLAARVDGKVDAVEYHEVRMKVGDTELSFPTGKGGEFYLENVRPGTYEASFVRAGKPCSFPLIIPESDELIVDLGGLVCEGTR